MRTGRLQAHPGSAHGTAVSRHLHGDRRRAVAPERGHPAGPVPDTRERRRTAGSRGAAEQGDDRAAAGGALPETRPARADRSDSRASTVPGDSWGIGKRGELQLSSRTVKAPARQPAADRAPQKLTPLSPQRYALQAMVDQETYDLLRHAQTLLGHQLSSGDIAPVLTPALRLLVRHLECRKFAAMDRPRRCGRSSSNPRHIPAAVKRAVRERDQDQCTFRSESGQRCPARTRLEFDHIEPVARGGVATVDGMRLRCRAHNQYDAECTFGAGFMDRKRQQAREAAAAAKRKQAAEEVIPYLKALGFRADESGTAAALCEATPHASLEQRVKLALTYFADRRCTRWRPPAPPAQGVSAANST